MKNLSQKLILLILLIGSTSFIVFAQGELRLRSNTEGFNFGLRLGVKHWSSDYFGELEKEVVTGGGMGLTIGYGLDQHWMIVGYTDYYVFGKKEVDNDVNFASSGIGVRYNLGGTLNVFRIYGEALFSYQSLTVFPVYFYDYGDNFEVKLKGGMAQLGAGVNYFIRPRFVLNVSTNASFGKFSSVYLDDLKGEEQAKGSMIKFNIGFSYYIRRP